MHSTCSVGPSGDVSLFFGLSGQRWKGCWCYALDLVLPPCSGATTAPMMPSSYPCLCVTAFTQQPCTAPLLAGTGKSTLSSGPQRHLVGDDEHVWTAAGVSNIEGGCYTKVIGLTKVGRVQWRRSLGCRVGRSLQPQAVCCCPQAAALDGAAHAAAGVLSPASCLPWVGARLCAALAWAPSCPACPATHDTHPALPRLPFFMSSFGPL